jgi:alpha-glucan,water dikinase
VIIADKVLGDEEIPDGVAAVIAPNVTDIVSHVAVRARNAHLLFASCYDADLLEHLKSLRGQKIKINVDAAGDVTFAAAPVEAVSAPRKAVAGWRPVARPHFTKFAIQPEEFNEQVVGRKACNQTAVRSKLPEWVHVPRCLAVPFGVFERVLEFEQNRRVAERYDHLVAIVDNDPPATLSELRNTILKLAAPEELNSEILRVTNETGFRLADRWDEAWACIKRVWASKWTDRAYLSRNGVGFAHVDLFMAVLVQEVINAEYAFVVHTANPFTNHPDELYAEVVVGLGETLVGNHPGRSLSFLFNKKTSKQTVLSYPSKSIGLFGAGVIFRSDSNAEDLAGYAGAGLYDSIILPESKPVLLDYSDERLVWDVTFRTQMVEAIARIGMRIEHSFGLPQDIEGAFADDQWFVVQTRPQVGLGHA